MTIGCNIWMICLKLNRFFYGLSRMLHLSEFVCTLRTSLLVVFNNFLLIDATDRSKISSDHKRFFIALSLYPLSFFANTPFKYKTRLILDTVPWPDFVINKNIIGFTSDVFKVNYLYIWPYSQEFVPLGFVSLHPVYFSR